MSWNNPYYRKWLLHAPLGLTLVGFGACLVAEAAILKAGGGTFWHWFGYGTLALIVLNTGLSFFGNAVLNRMRFERQREQA